MSNWHQKIWEIFNNKKKMYKCLPSLCEKVFLESGNIADSLLSILFIATLTRSAADPWTVVLTACLSA